MDIKKEEYEYFRELKEELSAASEKLDEEIEKEKAAVKEFKGYINEHYAEMDEKEVRENVDSAGNMALLVNADMERLRNLGFMIENPYFARLDYLPDDSKEELNLRFGSGSFWSEKDKKVKIFDWRAPIAALYYDYDLGPATYYVPDPDSRTGEKLKYSGVIKERLQTVVKDGELVSVAETGTRVLDNLLIEVLGGNAPEKMRPVISTIQKEQNDIIRDDESEVLVVDGRAGSGKTVIAMHRIAWLLYNNKRKLGTDNMLILSPNNIFTDYISRILPELMENPVPEKQWDDFISEIVFVDTEAESKAEQAEAVKNAGDKLRLKHLALKTSMAFYRAFEKYFNEYFGNISFKDFHFEKTTFPKEKLEKMFMVNFQTLPPYERFHNIAYFIMDDYLVLSKRNFTEGRQEKVQGQIRDLLIRQFAEIDIMEFYRGFLNSVRDDFGEIEITYTEDGKLSYEDVQVLLWLQVKLYGVKTYYGIKHLTVDEMQDYSIFQLAVIKELFKGRISFYGDRHQLLYNGEPVTDAISLLWPGAVIRELKKSYRSTAEITAYCNALLGDGGKAEAVERHGKEPEELTYASEDELTAALEKCLDGLKDKNYGSISILCENEEEAYGVFRSLKDDGRDAVFLSEQNAGYHGGLCVMSAFLAKGMEFDAVLVVSTRPKTGMTDENDRSLMYIACTRALHELYVFFAK
ncbi:MAG: AAA family ATPase [Lachnospiraceae bacterium]|nr:AAA family ATPase [Lachnospiraceae bacterium]